MWQIQINGTINSHKIVKFERCCKFELVWWSWNPHVLYPVASWWGHKTRAMCVGVGEARRGERREGSRGTPEWVREPSRGRFALPPSFTPLVAFQAVRSSSIESARGNRFKESWMHISVKSFETALWDVYYTVYTAKPEEMLPIPWFLLST